MALRLVVDNDRRLGLRRPTPPYDPLVHGVAQGLNASFPPIYLLAQADRDRSIAAADETAIVASDKPVSAIVP